MTKKILIGVGVYAAIGAVTAFVLPSAKGLSLAGKAPALALWPLWIATYVTGRAGDPTQAKAAPNVPAAPPKAGATVNDGPPPGWTGSWGYSTR